MLTREEALIRAEQLLDAEVRPWLDDEVAIDTAATLRVGTSWVFFYNSRIFLETKSMSHALVGNGPVIVSGEDGTTKLARSAIPWEEQVSRGGSGAPKGSDA